MRLFCKSAEPKHHVSHAAQKWIKTLITHDDDNLICIVSVFRTRVERALQEDGCRTNTNESAMKECTEKKYFLRAKLFIICLDLFAL